MQCLFKAIVKTLQSVPNGLSLCEPYSNLWIIVFFPTRVKATE